MGHSATLENHAQLFDDIYAAAFISALEDDRSRTWEAGRWVGDGMLMSSKQRSRHPF